MNQAQGTEMEERVMPAAIPDASDSDHIRIGEQVAEVLDHPGFQALVHALHINKESILRARMFRKPDPDAATYADAIGHLKGLEEVVPIARGLVQNGNEVAERRRREGVE